MAPDFPHGGRLRLRMWSPTQTPVSPHRKLPGFPAIDHRGLSLFLCGGLASSIVRRVIREYPEPFLLVVDGDGFRSSMGSVLECRVWPAPLWASVLVSPILDRATVVGLGERGEEGE